VQQRSAEFSFSKVEGDRTLFTVRASQTTEFKAGSKAVLEDVWITIYGRTGRRFDNIHTRACEYDPGSGRITCAGEVQIDLESAEEARQQPGQRVINIRAAKITFDRETGLARTDQPVEFRFPYGFGRGVGVTYSTSEAKVRLHGDVELTLNPPKRTSGNVATEDATPPAPIVLTGGSLEYQRDERTLRLLPPVRIRQGNRELTAGALALEFDPALRARRLIVSEHPQLSAVEPGGDLQLTADEFIAHFRPDGWTERVVAQGAVRGRWKEAAAENRIEAQRAELVFDAGASAPRRLQASGSVKAAWQAVQGDETRQLETESLLLTFAQTPPGRPRRAERIETLAPGVVRWSAGEETTRVRGQRLVADFDSRNRVRQIAGNSGVEIERRLGQRPVQESRSNEVSVAFAAGGGWTEMQQRGNVRFREGERTAQAERATIVRATDVISLTGSATVADSLTRTSAQALSFNQRTGEIRADGNVQTTYRAAEPTGITNFAAQPAHISAEQLRANRDSGQATYSGHARLWQGDAVIEAGRIELFRDDRRLEARGDVLALFPQEQRTASGTGAPGQRVLWRVRASELIYRSAERTAQLEESTSVQSEIGRITAPEMQIFFVAAPGEPQKLARALASGGVTVRQGERRGTAERAEYTAAEGKFVLSGGKPTLFDAARGTTTGRQLTFFLADDKILIDSEEGSRTLTRHRVEK
jgi:lipopolysaccharide export system protein LptA